MDDATNANYLKNVVDMWQEPMGALFTDLKFLQTSSGIVLNYCDFELSKTKQFSFEVANDFIEFSFHISGTAEGWFKNDMVGKTGMSVEPGESFLAFHAIDSVGFLELTAGQRYQVLNIYVAPAILNQLFGESGRSPFDLLRMGHRSRKVPFIYSRRFTPRIQTILDQMHNCPYQNTAKKLYQEGKVLELVANALWQIEEDENGSRKTPVLPKTDVDKLESARQILVQRISEPPSFSELAQAVQLSEKRLKRDFKAHFGITVFDYLRQHRINCAMRLLKEGRMNITDIAFHLGYCDTSHFIRAFSKYFGTSPGVIAKRYRS